MTQTPPRRRKPVRLPGYDYSQPGAYFFTSVCRDRALLFANRAIQSAVNDVWASIPGRFPTVTLDAFVVMPNHVHGIIVLNETHAGPTLGQVIAFFKFQAAKAVNGL